MMTVTLKQIFGEPIQIFSPLHFNFNISKIWKTKL